MALANLGSISTNIYNRVENITTAISGELLGIVDENRLFVESYTGDIIGSTAILEKYQPAITDLSTSDTLNYMEIVGVDASEVKLGEFTVKKGSDSNISSAAKFYKDRGMSKLKVLGRDITFKRVIGGR